MPAVSVIIPMYNVRPYIEDCLLSLKRQTFGDFEALCVDDGSTDGTLEAARKAGDDDARFSFLSQANAGQSAARNAGIARASASSYTVRAEKNKSSSSSRSARSNSVCSARSS